jgi:hypothetical protein
MNAGISALDLVLSYQGYFKILASSTEGFKFF